MTADIRPLKLVTTAPKKLQSMESGDTVAADTLPAATTSVQGAMSASDKTKLDGIAASAAALTSSTPADVAAAGTVGVGTTAARSDHVHGHGTQAGGTLHADAIASGAAGFMSGADKAKLDGVSANAAAVGGSTPAAVSSAGSTGVATTASRSDHVHAHGSQAGGSLHSAATESAAGFLEASDKTQLVDLTRVRELLSQTAAVAPDDQSVPEILWVIGQNRWRAGTSTAGYASAYFYAEMPTSFSGTYPNAFAATSDIALYSPIGVPNTDSPNSNAPANTETPIQASMFWDDGIPIPPGALTGGATLEIELFGALKIGRTGVLYVVIDPDGDVRLEYGGDNTTTAYERHKVLGAVSGVQTHTPGVVSDDGSGNCLITYTAHGLVDDDRVFLSTADRTVGIMPDLIDSGWYYVDKVSNDTFKPSTTPVAGATYVPFNPTPGESDEVLITRYTGSGSWKQVKFAFTLTTNTSNSDFVPCRLHITACADGRGSGDTEDGVFWYCELETFEVCDQIGSTTTTVAASEGVTGAKSWRAAASRTSPGKGQNGSAIRATGAPLLFATTDYDGSGTDAYITTAHDYGGQWDEICTDADLSASVPFVSVTSSVNNVQATTTILSVSGTVCGEVLEVLNGRRLVRYRPFSEAVRIKSGDTVDYAVYKRVSSTWSAVAGATGSFTAGAIRLGPQMTNLALRAAMSGVQDGTNVLDIRGGFARINRDRKR